MSAAVETEATWAATIAAHGFAVLPGVEVVEAIGAGGEAAALGAFATSWERLETDGHMADGGRYRLRRHANFTQGPGMADTRRGPHRPHFQAVAHNTLNGGIDRWFAPIEDAVAEGATLQGLLALGHALANARIPKRAWFIEAHQFRIAASAGAPGFPTPEGVHQDGVDLVLIAMLARTNLAGGETVVTDLADVPLARFTLTDPLDCAILDDRRVKHGVTPVAPVDARLPSCRDVLVLTWSATGGA